jgi:hypothetical protein
VRKEITMNNQERTWLDNASRRGGSFVQTFAMACYAADDANFNILRPVLATLMVKYKTYGEVKAAEAVTR